MNGKLYDAPDLTQVFSQWKNLDNSFIASKIFPEVPVDQELFYAWSGGKESLAIPTSTLLGDRAPANEAAFSRDSALKGPLMPHGLSAFISLAQQKRANSVLSLETQVVEGLASKMDLVDEKALADTLADTATVTNNTTLSSTDQWSDKDNSEPFQDVVDGINSMANSTPYPPNTIWMSDAVWNTIFNHPDFLARLGIAQDRTMTTDGFLNLFRPLGIENLYIGRARYNTAAEGQTASLSPVWGKHVWLGYITPTPGIMTVNGGYRFTLREARYVTREVKNNPDGTELVNHDYYDYILLSADNYYLIKNAVA